MLIGRIGKPALRFFNAIGIDEIIKIPMEFCIDNLGELIGRNAQMTSQILYFQVIEGR